MQRLSEMDANQLCPESLRIPLVRTRCNGPVNRHRVTSIHYSLLPAPISIRPDPVFFGQCLTESPDDEPGGLFS